MAIVTGFFGQGFSGRLGDLIFKYYTETGVTVVTALPDMSNIVWTERQIQNRQRMKLAHGFGKLMIADAETRAAFAAKCPCRPNRVYHSAVKLYMEFLKSNNSDAA